MKNQDRTNGRGSRKSVQRASEKRAVRGGVAAQMFRRTGDGRPLDGGCGGRSGGG